MNRLVLFVAIAALATLTACSAHDPAPEGHADGAHKAAGEMEHHKAEEGHDGHGDHPSAKPDSAPATAPGDVLPNDGTRKVGDITRCVVTGDVFTVAADSPKTEHDGGTYYFCCAGCTDKFTADPAKFLNAKHGDAPAMSDAEALPNDGTRKVGDVTKCPTSGKVFTVAADSAKYEHDGKTVWFCCAGCVDKYKASL